MAEYKYLEIGAIVNGYRIERQLGHGASCAAYSVCDENGMSFILKEYAPIGFSFRKDNGELITTNEEAFSNGLDRFRESLVIQRKIREKAKNSTPLMVSSFAANNTEYGIICDFDGECYGDVIRNEKSLCDLLKRMKAVADIVRIYHENNMLILDLKPENLFTYQETCEQILMIDFDSVADVGKNTVPSYSEQWSAPEVIYGKAFNKSADIFPIGEMLFFALYGFHSGNSEQSCVKKLDLSECRLTQGVNQDLTDRLGKLVSECIRCSKSLRPSADKLSKELSELIRLCDTPILCDNRPRSNSFFTGRKQELDKIEDELKEKRGVCIYGTGGVGKSELVRRFSESWKGTVAFLSCNGSIKNMLISGVCIRGIDLTKRTEQDALAQIAAAVDEHTLLVADNVDDLNNAAEELDLLLNLNCRLIVTTRLDSDKFNVLSKIPLSPMHMDELMDIFEANYSRKKLSIDGRNSITECLKICGGLPLMAELIAKQMTASRITPQKMLATLKKYGLSALGEESVEFGTRTEENTISILRMLFDMSKLDKAQLGVMRIMALAPVRGFEIDLVMKWSKQKNYNALNSLKRLGWLAIEYVDERELVIIHPLVSQLVLAFLVEKTDSDMKLAESFTKQCILTCCDLESIGDFYSMISVTEKERIFESSIGWGISYTNRKLAEFYLRVNRYADAEHCLLESVAELMDDLIDDDDIKKIIYKRLREYYFMLYEAALAQEKYESCLEYLEREEFYTAEPDATEFFLRRCEVTGRRDGKENQAELLLAELEEADKLPELKKRDGFYRIIIALIDVLSELNKTDQAYAAAEKYAEEAVRMQYGRIEFIGTLFMRFPDSDIIKKCFENQKRVEQSKIPDTQESDKDYFLYMLEGEYEKSELYFISSPDCQCIQDRYFFLLAIRYSLGNNPKAYFKALKTAEHAYGFFERLDPEDEEEYAFKVRSGLMLTEIRMCFLNYLTSVVEAEKIDPDASLEECLEKLMPDYEERWEHDIDNLITAANDLNEVCCIHQEFAWAYIHTAVIMISADLNAEADICLEQAEKIAEKLGHTILSEIVRLVRILLPLAEEGYEDSDRAISAFLQRKNKPARKCVYKNIGSAMLLLVNRLFISGNLDYNSARRMSSDIVNLEPEELRDVAHGVWKYHT